MIVATPAIEESWCHTASYTCAVAAIAALHGEDISLAAEAVAPSSRRRSGLGDQERFVVAGAGRDFPTAHEAVLKLREGAWVAAEPYETEQLLHGYLAAIDESVRAFVLEGKGPPQSGLRPPPRRSGRSAATSTSSRRAHPVVDIVRFQRLTLELAERRGREPDRIRRHDQRWARAAAAGKADNAA